MGDKNEEHQRVQSWRVIVKQKNKQKDPKNLP